MVTVKLQCAHCGEHGKWNAHYRGEVYCAPCFNACFEGEQELIAKFLKTFVKYPRKNAPLKKK